jgi:hypothetical protein
MGDFGLEWRANEIGEDCYLNDLRIASLLKEGDKFTCWNIVEGVVTNNLLTLSEAREYFEEDFAHGIEDALNLLQNTYPEFINEDALADRGFLFEEQAFIGAEDLMDICDLNELHEDE